jgi:carbon-monoxide dehydrogenase medium subunit
VGPRPFRYEAAASVEDAVERLRRGGAGAKALAGGQSLVPMMNLRLIEPDLIVDLNALPLDYIHQVNGHVVLGALVRHHMLEEREEVRTYCPLLSEAATFIGNVRVRSLGTLGGSLAHADPAAELPMASLALDAEFTLQGPEGRRTLPATAFFRGVFETALEPAEILTEVRVPIRGPREGWAVEEFSLRAGDFAIVAAAVRLRLGPDGRVELARIALGGVGPAPLRVPQAEDALVGTAPDPDRIERVGQLVAEDIQPESDVHASASYRRHLSYVLVRRGLRKAASRALGEDAA